MSFFKEQRNSYLIQLPGALIIFSAYFATVSTTSAEGSYSWQVCEKIEIAMALNNTTAAASPQLRPRIKSTLCLNLAKFWVHLVLKEDGPISKPRYLAEREILKLAQEGTRSRNSLRTWSSEKSQWGRRTHLDSFRWRFVAAPFF